MPTARISEITRRVLHELSTRRGETMQDIIEKAIELYRRQYILEESNQAFVNQQADSKAWYEEIKERSLWEASNLDGL